MTLFLVLDIPLLQTSQAQTKLTFEKIVISNEKEHDNIVDCCILVLTHTVAEFSSMKREQGLMTRDVMLKILNSKPLISKNNTIIFFRRYFKSLVPINNEDTQFFLSILHTISIIYKEIPFLAQDEDEKKTLKIFQESVERLFETVPLQEMNFESQQNIQDLVTHASEILFHQIKNSKNFWYRMESVYHTSTMVQTVLDSFEFILPSIEGLQLLAGIFQPDIISLMKYVVIAEMDNATNFSRHVLNTSDTWRNMHSALISKIENLPNQNHAQFTSEIREITDCCLLTVQIDFGFTKLHQFRHAKHPKTCVCNSVSDLLESPGSPLMKFNDWDYNHINLELFEDLEKFTQKLLNALDSCKNVKADIVMCFIDIAGSILKFRIANKRLVESVNQILLAIIASPFYKSFKDDPQLRTPAGFQKVLNFLPAKLKTFFEADNLINPNHLQRMQQDSIGVLSQLEISAINNPCWWLTENIMQYVMTQSDEVKTKLLCNFTNFIVNNSDKFSQCIEHYQKMLLNANKSRIVLEPLHEVLCLSGGSVVILKHYSSDNHQLDHFIVCDTCKLTRIIYPKDPATNETHRRMALMKDLQAHLVSSDRIAQVNKRLSFTVPILFTHPSDLFSKIPSLLNHSTIFQAWIEKDQGVSFSRAVLVKDESSLEKLDEHLNDILCNIKQMNFSETLKAQVLDKFFSDFVVLAFAYAYVEEQNLQHLIANMTFTFISNVPNEMNFVKCFRIFTFFIVQGSSKIMGEASNLALTMAKRNNFTLDQLLSRYQTFLMRHVVNLCIQSTLQQKVSLLSTMANVSQIS